MRARSVVAAGVGVVGELLLTAGALVLLFLVWQLWWTDVVADRAQAATVTRLESRFAGEAPREPSGSSGSAAMSAELAQGEAFAVMRIPRLGQEWERPVREGTDAETLTDGLGHYGGSAAPGEVGNFAVAGHRVTYGRPFHDIDTLRAGDPIVVETVDGWDVYTVRRHVVVDPSQVGVIAPVPQQPGEEPTSAWLTLTACHPRYSAAQRYVVFAELTSSSTRAEGPPDVLSPVEG